MILATAGHIDHGKTALVRALTGVDADRLPEEKRRGLTIDLGFAYATLPDGTELGFVDVPGHERFLPNMLAGVLSIDRVLLIVAADDGPRPQTLEHLDILELIGVAEITGVVTKIDRVEPRARRRRSSPRSRRCSPRPGTPTARSSRCRAAPATGIAALTEHLREQRPCRRARARAAAPPSGLFRMPIDRAFTLPGIGLVVTGTVAAGTRRARRPAADQPARRRRCGCAGCMRRTVRSSRPAPASAAQSISPAPFPTAANPGRGDWLVAPERHAPAGGSTLRCAISRLRRAPLRDGLPVHLHLGTEDVVGRARGAERPRDRTRRDRSCAQIDLEQPVGALLWRPRRAARPRRAPHPGRRACRRPVRAATRPAAAGPARRARGAPPADPARRSAHLLAGRGSRRSRRISRWSATCAGRTRRAGRSREFLRVGPRRAPVAVTAERLAALGDEVVEALAAWHQAQPDALGPARPAAVREIARPGARGGARRRARSTLAAAGRVVARRRACGACPSIGRGSTAPTRNCGSGFGRCSQRRTAPAAGARARRRAWRSSRRRSSAFCVVPSVWVASPRSPTTAIFCPRPWHGSPRSRANWPTPRPRATFTAAVFNDRSGVGRNLTIQILEYLDRMGIPAGWAMRARSRTAAGCSAEPAPEHSERRTRPGRVSSPVGRAVFKTVGGREGVLGRFDSCLFRQFRCSPTSANTR